MKVFARLASAARVLAACALSGCAGSGDGGSVAPAALSLPKMPDLTSALPQAPSPNDTPSGSATELYTRIARGAVGCWFGAQGGMKKDYIYHADADAPSRGGKAEVTIHLRDPSQPNPRGAKAYKILITPKDETTAEVTTQNLKMPEDQAKAMTEDVEKWARGEQGCRGASNAAGWTAENEQAKAAGYTKPAKGTSSQKGTAKTQAAKAPTKP